MKTLVEGPTKDSFVEFLAVFIAVVVLAMVMIAFFAFLTVGLPPG